jgi:hypothetical protein
MIALALLAACGNETEFHTLHAELALSPPSPLDFGEVVIGESAALDVYVTNAGRAELTVAPSVDPAGAFSIDAGDLTIPVDGSETVSVSFSPTELVPYAADLVLVTNDPEQPVVRYGVLGTGRPVPVPDIEGCTQALDFGTVATGATSEQICVLQNAGEADLQLGAVVQSGSGAFSLATDPTGNLVAPGESFAVIVRYAPTTDTGDSGELRFPSNDEDEPEVVLPLSGNGGGNAEYPAAEIVWGDPGTPPDRPCPAEVAPVADLPLSGANSLDPLGGGLTWLWSVVEAPPGAQGAFDDPSIVAPSLHVDVAGDWTVQLQVDAVDGTRSAPARCLITAVPAEDIRIELSWDGPTSDLDLHLAEALDTPLYAVPSDVSPCNTAPDWGAGGAANDPALDQDDADGLGPESIAVATAEDGTFPVRVHYFQRNADFSVTATVRVWLAGALAYSGSQTLDYNEVWEVGQINWPAATFGVAGGNPRIAESRQCE